MDEPLHGRYTARQRVIAMIPSVLIAGAWILSAAGPLHAQEAADGPCETGIVGTDPTVDSDRDSVPDVVEQAVDSDNDGHVDACDPDDDDDGLPTLLEELVDFDGDGVADPDVDQDGIPNRLDTDSDNDTYPDAAEWISDLDSDGILDFVDADSQADEHNAMGGDETPGTGGTENPDGEQPGGDSGGETPGPDETPAATPGADDPSTETPDPGDPIADTPAGDDPVADTPGGDTPPVDDVGDDDSSTVDPSPTSLPDVDPAEETPARDENQDGHDLTEFHYLGGGGCSTSPSPVHSGDWLVVLAVSLWLYRRRVR